MPISESACLLKIIWKSPKNISHMIQYSLLQLEMWRKKKSLFFQSLLLPFFLTTADHGIAHNDSALCG